MESGEPPGQLTLRSPSVNSGLDPQPPHTIGSLLSRFNEASRDSAAIIVGSESLGWSRRHLLWRESVARGGICGLRVGIS